MKLVHSSSDKLVITHLRNVLEGAGIACETRRDALGLAAGDIPFTEAWAELWVEDADAERAATLVEESLQGTATPAPGWTCACGETIEAQFDACWKCGAER